MSSNYWQMKKHGEPFLCGNTVIEKSKTYIKTWEIRCYSDGIPDEVPELLSRSMRVPSWKSIAMALLKNDLILQSLGFSGKDSEWYRVLKEIDFSRRQMDLFKD